MELTRYISIIVLTGLLSACASVKTQSQQPATFQQAMQAYQNSDYPTAVKLLKQIDLSSTTDTQQHDALLSLLISQYRLQRYSAAIQTADRFITGHPQSYAMDQALYLRGNSYFSSYQAAPSNISTAQKAQRDLRLLVNRFSSSPLTADARPQLDQLRQQMAHYELGVAQSSLTHRNYTAAANRSRYILEKYKETDAIPGAIKVLAKAYDGLGLANQAASTRAILNANFAPAGNSSTDKDLSTPALSTKAAAVSKPQPTAGQQPPLATATQAPAKPAIEKNNRVIQLATFKQPGNAERLDKRLREAGYSSFVSTLGDYHRVIVSNEKQSSDVQKLLLSLQQQFQLKGVIKSAASIEAPKH